MTEFATLRDDIREIRHRVDALAVSLVGCQSACTLRHDIQRGWIRYTGAVILALVPAALVYYFKH
jgi:hypothetical protein